MNTQLVGFDRHVTMLGIEPQHFVMHFGVSIADMAAQIDATVPGGATFRQNLLCYVRVGDDAWESVPQDMWHLIRPKLDGIVKFYARPRGGDGGGRILALVATVALTAIAPGIGTAAAGALFGSSTFAASLISAGFVVGGGLLVQRLFAGEQQQAQSGGGERDLYEIVKSAEADFNPLGRDSYPIRVFGTARVTPHDMMQPWPTIEDGVPTVTKLLGASGPHVIEDIKANGSLVADNTAITTETKDGQDGSGIITFVNGFANTVQVGENMDNFALLDRALEDQPTPINSTPVKIRFATKQVDGMAELAIRLSLSGFVKSDGSTAIRFPLRVRYWPTGGDPDTDSIYLPEIHLKGADARTRFMDLRLRRDSNFVGDIDIEPGVIDFDLWQNVPPVTAWPLQDENTGDQWQADANFVSGAGLQDVQNVIKRRHGLRFVMSQAIFPDGDYEWEITRGIVTDSTTLNSSYQISGNVVSLFVARNEGSVSTPDWRVPVAQTTYGGRVGIDLASVVSSSLPVQQPGLALIALKAKGAALRNVSAKLSGMARIAGDSYSRSDALTTTSNPADQALKLLEDFTEYSRVGPFSRLPRIAALAEEIIENTDWAGWSAQCTKMGATCSYVTNGQPLSEALPRLLAAGLARPAFGPKLRIDYFRNRSAEQPAITFSPRNGSSVRVVYESPGLPMGLRAKYRNKDRDWEEDELAVRAPKTGHFQNWLKQDIEAIDDPDWLRARLTFDLLRPVYWRTRYEVTTAIEGISVKPGTLVGIVTDLVNDRAHGARIREVVDDQTLRIDQAISPEDSSVGFGSDFNDFFEDGEQSFVQVLTPSGSELKAIVDASVAADRRSMTIVLDTALATTSAVAGGHISIGSLSNRIRRCIVVDPVNGGGFETTITSADEAPELYDYMKNTFGWAA